MGRNDDRALAGWAQWLRILTMCNHSAQPAIALSSFRPINSSSRRFAMKRMGSFLCAFLLITLPLAAGDNKKEQDRLENCGYVIKDILDIPDNIPQDLLDKAECVIIYPSVMKAAFIVSANYGRGAMTC